MILDRVTITGADDSIKPDNLIELSQQYPFVEWGLLFSSRRQGSPRYPSAEWCSKLINRLHQAETQPQFSMHLCGSHVRRMLNEKYDGWKAFPGLYRIFDRVQLNFHARAASFDMKALTSNLKAWTPRPQFIFQHDNVNDELLSDVYASEYDCEGLDLVPLFDCSHGAGVVPRQWPKPVYIGVTPGEHGEGVEYHTYHGYAGGLGPDTLEQELPRIAEAAGDARVWVDMETRVRSHSDWQFDLAKVRRCLEICEPLVAKQGAAS